MISITAVLTASIAIAAPALGAFDLLASFGPTGSSAGTISPAAAGIAVAADGRVYVADSSDGRIETFTNDGTADGAWGGFDEPSGVAAAPDGTIVVADEDGVRRYAAGGSLVETLLPEDADRPSSDEDDPAGVAVADDGTVYVAQPGRHRVTVPGGTTTLTGLAYPVAVAVSADGTVYVADHRSGDSDHGAGRVVSFHPDGQEIESWSAHDPHGIAVTPDGTVLVTDKQGNRILRFGPDGVAHGSFSDQVNSPRGVASDCRGRAYVVDNSALRVHVYGQAGDPPPCETAPEPEIPQPTAPDERTDTTNAGSTPGGEVASVFVTQPPPEPQPILGVQGRATAVDGEVQVGQGKKQHKLKNKEIVPVGETIDSGNGRVKLEFETAPGPDREKYGRYMSGEFYDGTFTIAQTSNASLVDLNILDEIDAPSAGKARAAAKKRLKVWGNVKGKFRTVGRNGAATVRSTQWLTEERDDGTLFRVREGVVEVKDFTTGKVIILNPGDSYLAKPPCVSRRAFTIRLRKPFGTDIADAAVTVAGKRVAVRRGSRLTVPIDLRGMPAGNVRVRIRIDTTDGRRITGTRVYRTCSSTPRIPSGPPEI